jgi:xylose dehydrogenase (NAD/NADP)
MARHGVSTRETLNWGLLGTARINRLVIPAIRSSTRSRLAAVASRDAPRADAYAAEWKIPTPFHSYEALLASPDIDIVYVSLPNSLHADWSIRALDGGKHVLCEKPLALTTNDVQRMSEASTRAHRVLMEGFMYRHHAQSLRTQELMRAGTIGDPRVIVSAFSFLQARQPDVRLDPDLGGGCLWDVGCYPVSIGQHLAHGSPVTASGWQQLGATGVDETFAGCVTYSEGTVLQFHCGFRATYHTFLRVVGTEGVLHVERPFRPNAEECIVLIRNGTTEQIEIRGSPAFVDQVVNMEDAVLGEAPPRITIRESWTHIATLQALYRAARNGCAVTIPASVI